MRSGGRNNQKVNKKDGSKLLMLAVLSLILVCLVVFLPKKPMVVARNAQGGASGQRYGPPGRRTRAGGSR